MQRSHTLCRPRRNLLEQAQQLMACAALRATSITCTTRQFPSCGLGAFSDRSRRPHRQANRLPLAIEATIVRLKRDTVHAVLDRHRLVKRRRRRRHTAAGRYCYRLTITNSASRYLLTHEALSTTQEKFALTAFERTFKR